MLCGSAVRVMSELLSGTKPLRGRAVLDLRLPAFATARAHWGLGGPAVALQVDAVLGGAPCCWPLAAGTAPQNEAEFGPRVERTLLDPGRALYSRVKAGFLLREDPRSTPRCPPPPFAHGKRSEGSAPQIGPHLVEECLDALPVLHGTGRLPVHSGRASAPVPPHPIPRDQQERGIGNEIEQIIEPAITIVGRPTVQLGLHLQYPALGLEQRELQRVGIHRRPPGIAASSLPTCWPPSPCTELSSARTTTGPPPHLRPSAGNGPALLAGPAVRKSRATAGGSHVHHVPIGQVGVPLLPRQHHHAYAADLQRGLPTGSWRPASKLTAPVETSGHVLHPGPISARLESGDKTYGALHGFLFVRLLALLAEPDASGSSAPSRRCQGCFPSSPAFPGPDCPQLLPGRCDGPAVEVSHLHSVTWRLVAHPTVLPLDT